MTTFNKFQIADAPFYKRASFDFTENAVTAVTGRNLNTGSSNAAGKTLFFQYLRDFIFGTDVQQDRTRDGKWAFSWTTAKGSYHAVRTARNGKESLTVKEKLTGATAWVDMGIREIRTAREFIRDSIGYNEEEFDSLVFLDTRPHPLISGNTAARKNFFTKFFRLDQQDDIGKLVNAKLAEITKLRVEHDTLVVERKAAIGTLTAIGDRLRVNDAFSASYSALLTSVVERHADRLKTRVAGLQRALEGALRARKHVDLLSTYESRLPSLERVCGGSLSGYQPTVDKLTRKIKRQRAELRIIEQRSDLLAQHDDLEKRLAAVSRSVAKDSDLTVHQQDVDACTEELAELDKGMARAEAKMEAAERERRAAKATVLRLSKAVTLEEFIRDQSGEDVHLSDYDCPTCGQRVHLDTKASDLALRMKVKHRHSESARLADLTAAKEKLAHWAKEHTVWSDTISSLPNRDAIVRRMRKSVAYLADQKTIAAEQGSYAKQIASVARQLRDLSEVSDVDVDDLNQDIERTETHLSKMHAYRDVIEPLQAALSYRAKHGDGATADTQALLAYIHNGTTKITKLESYGQRINEASATVTRLTFRIRELRTALADEEPYRLLSKAFSKRGGVRQHQINAICQRLEQLTNQYARLLFTEDYHFTFQLDTHFNIMVERSASDIKSPATKGRRKKGDDAAVKITTDVRRLSAAERKMFALVLIPALMSFVPKDRRSNLLILDEPDANMSAVVRESLVRFLPTLNKIVPNIIYVTPHSDLLQLAVQEGVRMTHYEVTKRGSVATLERK